MGNGSSKVKKGLFVGIQVTNCQGKKSNHYEEENQHQRSGKELHGKLSGKRDMRMTVLIALSMLLVRCKYQRTTFAIKSALIERRNKDNLSPHKHELLQTCRIVVHK